MASVLAALRSAPTARWAMLAHGDRPLAVSGPRFTTPLPHRFQFHGGWLANELILPVATRLAGASAFHATEPSGVPDPALVGLVATVHDLTPLTDPEVRAGLWPDQRLGFDRMLRKVRRAQVVVAVSDTVRGEIAQRLHVEAGRIHVVYPSIDLGRWRPPDTPAQRHGLLFVGAPEPHKNLDLVLRALARLPVSARPCLTIVGPWSPAQVRALEDQAGRASVRVSVEPGSSDARLLELYQQSLALVMPSRREGFGLPVLEAMAAGCPVLASSIPVLKEVAGGAARHFSPRDPDDLAAAISALVDDPSTAPGMSAAGRARAARFTPAATLAQLAGAYRAAGVDVCPPGAASSETSGAPPPPFAVGRPRA